MTSRSIVVAYVQNEAAATILVTHFLRKNMTVHKLKKVLVFVNFPINWEILSELGTLNIFPRNVCVLFWFLISVSILSSCSVFCFQLQYFLYFSLCFFFFDCRFTRIFYLFSKATCGVGAAQGAGQSDSQF